MGDRIGKLDLVVVRPSTGPLVLPVAAQRRRHSSSDRSRIRVGVELQLRLVDKRNTRTRHRKTIVLCPAMRTVTAGSHPTSVINLSTGVNPAPTI